MTKYSVIELNSDDEPIVVAASGPEKAEICLEVRLAHSGSSKHLREGHWE